MRKVSRVLAVCLLVGLTLALVLVACGRTPTASVPTPVVTPQPSEGKRVLGVAEVTLTGIGTESFSSEVHELGSKDLDNLALGWASSFPLIQELGNSFFDVGTRGVDGMRHISVNYVVRNADTNGNPLPDDRQNLTFLFIAAPWSTGVTPYNTLRNADNASFSPERELVIAQSIKPTVVLKLQNGVVSPAAGLEDLQVFSEAEVGAISLANEPGFTVFPFGFVTRNVNSTSSRTLPANPTATQFDGRVTFALEVPLAADPADDLRYLSFVVIAMDDSTTRVTESLDEQGSTNVMTRASALGASVNVLPGSSYVGDAGVEYLCSVRTAGTPENPVGFLVRDTSSAGCRVEDELPPEWHPTSLGGSGAVSFDATNASYTLSATGGTQLAAQTVTGSEPFVFEACFNLDGTDSDAKAGLVFYQSLNASSYQAPRLEVVKTAAGAVVTADSGSGPVVTAGTLPDPQCLRLVRSGATVSAYERAAAPASTAGLTTTGLTTAAAPEWLLVTTGTAPTTPFEAALSLTSPGSSTATATLVNALPAVAVTAAVSATPASGNAPLTVSFDASGSTGTELSYTWDFDLDDDNDGQPDPLTVDATGVTASHTFDTAGSYTVTLTATDVAGRQATATTTIDVQDNQDPEADPATETVAVSFGDDSASVLGIGVAPFENVFDASASLGTDLSYSWNFGDGGSASGAYVTHLYANPGNYTVTLTITNSVGRTHTLSKPVSVLPNLDVPSNPANGVSPEWLNLENTSTLNIDIGQPLPGLSYTWNFGDGSSGQGTQLSHTYSDLGMYELTLKVADTAAAASQGFNTQSISSTDLFERSWLPNVWRAAPEAGFTFTAPNGAGNPVGTAPMAVGFDASASTGASELTYLWDFGDGTTSSAAAPSHTFEEGEHVVTLTVADEWGQLDSYRAYLVARNENFFGQLRFDYPTLPAAALTFNPNAEIDSLMQQQTNQAARSARASPGAKTMALSPEAQSEADLITPSSTSGVRYDSTFPYVVHNSGRLQRAIFRWTPWTAGNTSPYVFCQDNRPYAGNEGIGVHYNGIDFTPLPFEEAFGPPVFLFRANFDTLYEFCFMVQLYTTSANNGYPILPRSENVVDVTAVRHDYRYSFDSFAGLRVPKVHLSILPDQMLPGDLASPFITENTYTEEGVEQLALTVQVRESEAQGNVSFDLPVYAVDQDGALVDATGYFKGDIEGLTSDCGDCVMVNGKATMRVTLPVSKDAAFDLTNFKLYATPSCDYDNAWLDTRYGYLRGCSSVTATHAAPTGLQNVEPFPFEISPLALAAFDTVAVGGDVAQREAFYKNFGDTSVEVIKFGIGLLPFIGDGVDLTAQALNFVRGKDVDYFLVFFATGGLAIDLGTGGLGDITTPIKVVYKLSKQAVEEGVGGVFAEVMQQALRDLVDNGASIKVTIETLGEQFTTLSRLSISGGPAAIKSADQLARGLMKLPCPVGASGFSTLSVGCSPAEISNSVSAIVKSAFNDDVQPKSLTEALTKVCCEAIDGGNGYIDGAENLVGKAAEQNQSGPLKGIIGEARAGDNLRNSGFNGLKFPKRNSYTITVDGDIVKTEPDLIGTKNGIKRVFEVKSGNQTITDREIAILKEIAKVEGDSVVPTVMTLVQRKQGFYTGLRAKGIDVLDANGNLVN